MIAHDLRSSLLNTAFRMTLGVSVLVSQASGDILRGGNHGGSAPPAANPTPSGGSAPSVTNQARNNAQDSLARTTQALAAVRAMQLAARNNAINGANNLGNHPLTGAPLPNVPNGLGSGGLQLDSHVASDASWWQGAELPTQTTNGGQTSVTVKQTAQQALLNWETFNVGKNTTLSFDQSAGGSNASRWIAFNKVNDPTGNPTQILGSIKAQGQVYVINRNGIIFGGSSQVNTGALTASALPINDDLVASGLLNNAGQEFLFDGLGQGRIGDITVQAGAQITTPLSTDGNGGRVFLAGANVTNNGTLTSPSGQVILAAGLQIGVAAHSSGDPSLRGLDVFVGAVVDPSSALLPYAGTVTNRGLIEIPRASTMLTGKTIQQNGAIEGTTSVSLNGRIDLLANYGAVANPSYDPLNFPNIPPLLFKSAGTVTLGEGSITTILPEIWSAASVVANQWTNASRSQVNLQGLAIHLDKDSTIFAPNADVKAQAGAWNYVVRGGRPQSDFLYSTGQIYLDAGAVIDVSGSKDVQASVADQIVAVQLLGAELADSPLQRDGILRGQTVYVDAGEAGTYNGRDWVGTPLADASGYIALMKRTVGQLTAAGGSVTLKAGDSVVMQAGSRVDVSGGSVDYAGGAVETTRLVSGGHIYDISEATPDLVYDGIYGTSTITSAKWGVTRNYAQPLANGKRYQAGYVMGGTAGSITISAAAMALDGALDGNTTNGSRQLTNTPTPGSLSLIFEKQNATTLLPISPTPPSIVFRPDASLAPADPFALDASGRPMALRADRVANVILSPDLLTEHGFGTLSVTNSDGSIVVPEDVSITAPVRGSITLSAANITIDGKISAPGGSLKFTAYDYSPYSLLALSQTAGAQTPAPDPTRGLFTLGANASLSTAGLIVDDRLANPTSETLPWVSEGGAISIAAYSADLKNGGLIDVSGGVIIDAKGKEAYGDAGSITIRAGQDPTITSLIGGKLALDSTLKGYAGMGAVAGKLAIQAPLIQIGGSTENADTLLLSPVFFSTGGFGSFSLTGPAGVQIAAGTRIAPEVQSWRVLTTANDLEQVPVILPEGMRTPVSLALNAPGVSDHFTRELLVRGDIVMGAGSSIFTDAKGSVSMDGNTVAVLGSITTPGGSIAISGGADSTALFADQDHALPTVYLASGSSLSAGGKTLLIPDDYGYRTGAVLNGGQILVSGNIVAEEGAILDVSGTAGILDLVPSRGRGGNLSNLSLGGLTRVPTRVESDGGNIALTGKQELFLDATLLGRAGGSSAQGGSLSISSGHFIAPNSGAVLTPLDTNIQVTQSGKTIPASFYLPGQTAIGRAVVDGQGNILDGLGYFSVSTFDSSGMGALSLAGNVRFAGPVNLAASRSLAVATGGILSGDSTITLSAPYLAVGTGFQPPREASQIQSPFQFQGAAYPILPTYGSGNLKVSGDLIDIGYLSLQGIGNAEFVARNGDIRGNGILDVAGSITLEAGQIYPPTATCFTIAAYDYQANGVTSPGTVTIKGSGTRKLPLSAGGTLNIYASIIHQGGVLRAPFGTINLGWDGQGSGPVDLLTGQTFAKAQQITLSNGSITSVSAIDPITGKGITIPYGITLNDTSWIDPNGTDITASGLPDKAIHVSAAQIDDEAGSIIDIRGGGDLLAYQFEKGTGGTLDFLDSSSSFAIIPGYESNYAPYAPFNPVATTPTNLGSDRGYVNSTLKAGDRVYLADSKGLPAGYYTLLPARYALLSGAFLVTPKGDTPSGSSAKLVDGASLVSGYRINASSVPAAARPLYTSFEVASSAVVQSRGEYKTTSANGFFAKASTRRPEDAGHLVLAATQAMTLAGSVTSGALGTGRAGMVDISSSADILIAGLGVTGQGGGLVLDAGSLNNFGAESLLIGGTRQSTANGTTINVSAGRLTVDNAGTPLIGSDLILVANQNLELAAGAEIQGSKTASQGAETLYIGNPDIAGSGDGLLVRVSNDPLAQVLRAGVSTAAGPTLTLGDGARLAGGSIILDSTHATSLAPSISLSSSALTFASGQISIALNDPGAIEPSAGLVLAGGALQALQSGLTSLTLQSYSSIDLYGNGSIGGIGSNGLPAIKSLSLQASEIRGLHNSGGSIVVSAQNLTLGNRSNGQASASVQSGGGSLVFNAGTIRLGPNQLAIDRFADVSLNTTAGILAQGSGRLTTQGDLILSAPLVSGETASNYTIESGGDLLTQSSAGNAAPSITGGLGATLTLQGRSVTTNSDILLPSGILSLHATAGDVSVGGRLDVGGTQQNFFDQKRYTGGGQITLTSDSGNVITTTGSVIDVAAYAGGGQAGGFSVNAVGGTFNLAGSLLGQGGSGGTFSGDVGNLTGSGTSWLDGLLNAGGFTQSRTLRVRDGDVIIDGLAKAGSYNLSADQGSITVTGTIDASGATGGAINLAALRDITLSSGSLLTVKGQDFDAAGKGGSISLETRGNGGSAISIQAGSILDLSVASNAPSQAALGRFTGTLHLRAPQTSDHSDVQINPIAGTIRNASSIVVEGFNSYLPANGSIDSVKADVLANGNEFLGSAGTTTAGYLTMWNRLLGAGNESLASVLSIRAGAEIVNPGGDLTLSNTWDLSSYRFGPDYSPGVLTLRAAGNLNFNFRASLNDGFDGSTGSLWQAPLLAAGSESWSYRLIAGADLSAADFRKVQPLTSLGENSGSIILGKGSPALPIAVNNSRQSIVPTYYQTIRTGTGDIDIHAGRDVLLLNSLATIYTAGTQAPAMANFDLPNLDYRSTSLGATQSPIYPAQYSLGGGNVTITAQNDIARYNVIGSGSDAVWTPDSTRELPSNWLYRRGYVDPATGEFAASSVSGEIGSTSWWIDFSNFYEGVGALGGGNVTLAAGRDVSNVDAVVPTNARMPKGRPGASALLELGGGNLSVRAGRNINGGVYYVERGQGSLDAGGSILTNSTRAALTQTEINSLAVAGRVPDSTTWLPTTLFLGKGGFDASAGGDLLLGAVANPFLLPQGINNSFYNKTYFSTFDASSFVNASSLTGSIVFKNDSDSGEGSLERWYQNVLLYYGNPNAFTRSQPWLRLAETSIAPFRSLTTLMPGTLRATAFSGDIGIVGKLTLSPSSTGTLDLIAAGSINGLQVSGVDSASGAREWAYGSINLSDADPFRIPGFASPRSLPGPATGFQGGVWNFTAPDLLADVNALFDESGSVSGSRGVLQAQQALHAPGILHADDEEPVRLYAGTGDISGLTLFSAKSARVIADGDIADVSFYLQNTRPGDISLISAGGDINAYNPNSVLRGAAQAAGNVLSRDGTPIGPLAGDFQISGPGTLEVLAGRNLDLGVGPNNPDGTAVGITSIGNSRNPALPAIGADIIAAAGIGASSGLDASQLDFTNFIALFLNPGSGGEASARYLPELGELLGLSGVEAAGVWNAFQHLPAEHRNILALEIFYHVLRDTGRDFNSATSLESRSYDNGLKAIAALFPGDKWQGDISLTSRAIKTTNGGSISLLAPGGELNVGFDIGANQPVDQGVLTEAGGNISIFTHRDVNVGTSRIFTLRGGNEIIWSSTGNIAAGASAKTVQAAPPTRVLIDPQSAAVQTDLAGLATGGGIGVLDTVPGVAPGDVDLIAPIGSVDAGDAGIRVSGNLTIAAPVILNSSNIQVAGNSAGFPVAAASGLGLVSAPSVWNTSEPSDTLRNDFPSSSPQAEPLEVEAPSVFTVEVIEYTDDDGDGVTEEQQDLRKTE